MENLEQYAPTPEEIINAKDKSVSIVGSSNAFKKYSKFLMAGMAALMLASPVMAQQNNYENGLVNSFQSEVMEHVVKAKELGLLTSNINVHTNVFKQNINGDYKLEQELTKQTNVSFGDTNNCNVEVTFSKDGKNAYNGESENLFHVTLAQNEHQQSLARERVVLHEASHCEFASIKNPILVDGNPQLEKNMNYYFNYGLNANEEKVSSIYGVLNENFADTYALVQMIKMHGDSQDMQWLMNSLSAQREEMSIRHASKGSMEEHSTQFSIQQVNTPEIKDKIAKTNDPTELKHIALEIANKGVQKLIATYADRSISSYSPNVIRNAIHTVVLNDLFKEVKSQNINDQNMHTHTFEINQENSFAAQLAPKVLETLKSQGITANSVQKSQDGTGFLIGAKDNSAIFKEIDNKFDDAVTSNIAKEIRQTMKDYTQYTQNKNVINQNNLINRETKAIDIALKVMDIQDSFINKTNVMNNIQKVRSNIISISANESISSHTIK